MSPNPGPQMLIQLGQLWWVTIPYTDNPKNLEKRPCVVVGWSGFTMSDDQVILVVPITSFSDGGTPKSGDIEIPNPRTVNLTLNSHARSTRLQAIHPSRLVPMDSLQSTLDENTLDLILRGIADLFNVSGIAQPR